MNNFAFVCASALLLVFCVMVAGEGKIGEKCAKKDDCKTFGADCTKEKCACEAKYVTTGNACLSKVNATCKAKTEPYCITNAECSDDTCSCKKGYTSNKDGTACENGSTVLTASLALTIAAIVTSQFY